MKRSLKFITLLVLMLCVHTFGWGQVLSVDNNKVTILNNTKEKLTIRCDGKRQEPIEIGDRRTTPPCKKVEYRRNGNWIQLWPDTSDKIPEKPDIDSRPEDTKKVDSNKTGAKNDDKKDKKDDKKEDKKDDKKDDKKQDKKDDKKDEKPVSESSKPVEKAEPIEKKSAPKKKAKSEDVIKDFDEYIEQDSYYNRDSIKAEERESKEWLTNINNSKDKEAYIKENDLEAWVIVRKERNEQHDKDKDTFVEQFIENKYSDFEVDEDTRNALFKKLDERIEERENNIYHMKNAVEEVVGSGLSTKTLITIGIVVAALALLIFVLLRLAKKKKQPTTTVSTPPTAASHYASSGPATIVIKQKNGTVLRKQNIDDVIDNDNYLKIDSNEFCADSAVQFIYVKNTCIKSIYHLYAEDLRNPDRQKEDGCMVLGRWVYREDCRQYDVTLEEIVLPGDDAVFKEYELNFGGKIQMKKTEKLRLLRRNTELQYDLTCWVHSHPGLGVFFSNADTNVHTQLKHPTHPSFLTAMVVDILTPNQETGIFTFKRDNSIASKNDLLKMYSLEKMYKWAVESERTAFKPEHHFNTLSDTEVRADDCHSIQLCSGSVIDMDMLTNEHKTGITAFAHGYTLKKGEKTEMVVTVVSERESVADAEWIGCFVSCPTYNITQVRKSTTGKLKNSQFVLVYSADNDTLTTIPVVGGRISVDEKTYGKQKFEDLKTWTRRRR